MQGVEVPVIPPFCEAYGTHLLVVTHIEEDRLAMRRLAEQFDWIVCESAAISEASECLRHARFPVVVCEENLPDGNWKGLFVETEKLADAPSFVVVSRFADCYLWAEALNLGAFDVLSTPFVAEEVHRAISSASKAKHPKQALAANQATISSSAEIPRRSFARPAFAH